MNCSHRGQVTPLRTTVLVAVLAIAWGAIGCETDAPDNGAAFPRMMQVHVTPILADILIQINENNPDFVIIDVRTAAEYSSGHIEGAINLDFRGGQTFRDDLDALDKNKTYLIYCRSGNRSGQTLPIMEDLGFMKVYNLSGGINRWTSDGYTLEQ